MANPDPPSPHLTTHGLTAQAFALAPGEDGEAFQELLERLVARYRPQDEVMAHLVQRLASVMWRQQRADRLEAEVLEQRDYAGANLYAPLVWDAARFSAVQRHQARLDRTLFRLLDELERHAPAMEEVQNEPEAADADAGRGAACANPAHSNRKEQNEPEAPGPAIAGRPQPAYAPRGEGGGPFATHDRDGIERRPAAGPLAGFGLGPVATARTPVLQPAPLASAGGPPVSPTGSRRTG